MNTTNRKWFVSYEIERRDMAIKLHTFIDGEDAEDALSRWLQNKAERLGIEIERINVISMSKV
ncbi:hypothetical protein [Serratia sp. KG1D]|uniref:hypothetical protein n=1 Tax=Serratia sp. KG1D TaxID=3120277 RepID=UPI003018EB8B